MSILDYEKRFSSLRLNRGRGSKSPHKVAMLQAVMDLMESGLITTNQIKFDENLKRRFTSHFETLATPNDRNNPHLPFFHLRSEGFWHHKVRPGHNESYDRLTTAHSPGVIDSNILFAFLDDELYELLGNHIARELLRTSLLRSLDEVTIRELLKPERGGWDWLECEFLVKDYLTMLEQHLVGQPYSKASHRRVLKSRLNNRSDSSIEYKHQNVSAILLELGLPYIPGYKPAFNYQRQLKQVILSHLAGHPSIVDDIGLTADRTLGQSEYQAQDWSHVFDPTPPERIAQIAEDRPSYLATRIDFAERERRNRQLGERAEEFVLSMERKRLTAEGRPDLAAEVEWTSKERGDGLGYDIRSFDAMGDGERFLEVKATQSGKYQPFFISENERAFSNQYADAYRLYRVYDFGTASRFFILPGAVEQHLQLLPQIYKARF